MKSDPGNPYPKGSPERMALLIPEAAAEIRACAK